INLSASVAVSANYWGTIRSSVADIERGAYDEAAAAVFRVSLLDDRDTLGHKLMGIIYLHANRLGDAELEFQKALKADPEDWQSQYALGLIYLTRKQISKARTMIQAAGKHPGSPEEVMLTLDYLDFLSGEALPTTLDGTKSSALAGQLMSAIDTKAGRREQAIIRLQNLVGGLAQLGFEEKRAPLATFDVQSPIKLPQSKLTWKPGKRRNERVVSGRVTLRADASRSSGVSFVALYVDDAVVGVTNCEPYEFVLDTTKYSNGLHEIRMEGKDSYGVLVSQKSFWVHVNNPRAPSDDRDKQSESFQDISKKLWNCIRLTASQKVMRYQLAMLYLEAGDTGRALTQLQYVVAYEPGYRDARKLLNQLRGVSPSFAEINKGPGGSKRIAITFDDGPNERTAELLDILARYGVPATFFVVGFRAQTQPDLMKAIHEAGHEIANHTYTHPDLSKLSADDVEAELSKTEAAIYEVTGKSSLYFRPPGGHISEATKQAAARQGFKAVFWTVGCSRYEGTTKDELVAHVVKGASDGAIVLMHNGEPVTCAALPVIIEQLRAQGYQFVTLSNLLSSR
ncbi:MAG: polysaccharide deacetylase family protein, partial [Armatimonadota bacterium]